MQAHITMTGLQSTGNDIYGESISFGFWNLKTISQALSSLTLQCKRNQNMLNAQFGPSDAMP